MANVGNLDAYKTAAPSVVSTENKHIYRSMDDSTYSSGHADETILLAGPARVKAVSDWTGNGLETIGVSFGCSWSESRNIQPMKIIGSSRNIFTTTSSNPVQISMNTMLMHGTSMLNNLYHNARLAGVDLSKLEIKPYAGATDNKVWSNLSSNVYNIPFGMGIIFRDSSKRIITGLYFELCYISQLSTTIQPGATSISQSVGFVADRVIPWNVVSNLGDVLKAELDKANIFFGV